MNEVTYGFVDENSILFATARFVDGDTETIERVKNEYSASACYKMDLEKELDLFGTTYWNGSRFVLPSPYPSWIFDEELNQWVAPVPYPEDEFAYLWNEELLTWQEYGLFIQPKDSKDQPYPSWILNPETNLWESPVGLPIDENSVWNEKTLSWQPIMLAD